MFFNFMKGKTAKFLEKKGFFRPELAPMFVVKEADFTKKLAEGEAVLTDSAAYLLYPNDVKIPIYFYKRQYSFQFNAQGELTQKPKFHIRECQTILQFGKDNYNASNDKTVKVRNSNYPTMGEEFYELTLEICQNCIHEHSDFGKVKTTDEFNAWVLQQIQLVRGQVDRNGYPLGWSRISKEYRKYVGYVCENPNCQRDLSMHRKYLHVHHLDHNKQNCDFSNLKALCIRCHAEQDDVHENNFSKGLGKRDLDEFNRLFPKE